MFVLEDALNVKMISKRSSSMHRSAVLLSICIPSYNRPKWLRRSLESIIAQPSSVSSSVEIIVSDDSTNPECRRVAEATLSSYSGLSKYVHNEPRLGMAENWNHAIQLASGTFIHVLHDDDYLVEGALGDVVDVLKDSERSAPLNLFGVNVVNQQTDIVRRQRFRRFRYLDPDEALRRILSNPTFVRFPGMILRRDVFETLGYFRPALGSPADTEMWARVAGRYGLACHSTTLANFTAHPGALTMEMFNGRVVETLDRIFDEVRNTGRAEPNQLNKWKSAFLHKFILGGTCRYLKWREISQASKTMRLFEHPVLDNLNVPLKWLPLRLALSLFFFCVPARYTQVTFENRGVANGETPSQKSVMNHPTHSKPMRR